jgi:HEAT repeat protein
VGSILCALGPVGKPAVPALVRSLKEKTARSPKVVIEILSRIGPDAKEALPVLTTALEDPRLRWQAVEALCGLGPAAKDAIPAIRQAIRESYAQERVGNPDNNPMLITTYLLVTPLAQLGGDAVPLLLEFLDEENINFKRNSVEALGKIGPPAQKAVPALAKLLKNDDPTMRQYSARALWRIDKNTSGIPVLVAFLRHEPYWAKPAADALGEMGPAAKSALPELEKSLSAVNADVRPAVLTAIEKIDPDAARKIKSR